MAIINRLKPKEIEEMKLNTENFNKILNTCSTNFNYQQTSKSNRFLNTSINNFTNTTTGNYTNRTLPNIFKVELRKTKKEKDQEKKSKIELYKMASTNYNLNTLNDFSSYSSHENDIKRKDFSENHNLKSYQQDSNYHLRTKILNGLDRDYNTFFNKLQDKSRKFKSLCMKELGKKAEMVRRQRKKFYDELDRNNKKVLRIIEKLN